MKIINLKELKEKGSKVKKELYVLYLAFKHKDTPWYAKALTAVIISYAFSPIDLIPDFIPVLGYLDDLILIPAGIAFAIKLIPKEVIEECRKKELCNDEIKHIGIYSGIAIGALWTWVIISIVKRLMKK